MRVICGRRLFPRPAPEKKKKTIYSLLSLLSSGLFFSFCFFALKGIPRLFFFFFCKSPCRGQGLWCVQASVVVAAAFVFFGCRPRALAAPGGVPAGALLWVCVACPRCRPGNSPGHISPSNLVGKKSTRKLKRFVILNMGSKSARVSPGFISVKNSAWCFLRTFAFIRHSLSRGPFLGWKVPSFKKSGDLSPLRALQRKYF